MTLWSMAALLFLVVFFGTLVIKLSGPYYDQFTLDSMLSELVQEVSSQQMSKSEFKDRLSKNLDINNIDLDPNRIVDINTRSNNLNVILDYEKRIHIFGNVDVVLSFHEEYGI